MGTRSLTVMKNCEGKEIAVLYRQFDGYPDGHGKELAEFLNGMEITNGIKEGKTANGMDCLAAQIIANFKQGAGGFYLYPAGTRDCGEDYTYFVSQTPEKWLDFPETATVEIRIESYDKKIFEGSPQELINFKEPVEN